ncbi:MAG: enoyl-CoA hydratase/isomerase family protein, partial [Desulfobacterales bacterium]
MQPSEPFIVENKGGIAWLTLNRPEKHNAMDLDFFAVLPRHLQNLTDDSDVRVLVIKAAGKSFSAGTDLSSAAAMVGSGGADERRNLHRKILALQEGINAVEKC